VASIISDIFGLLVGLAEGLTHNVIGLAIVGIIAFFIYIKWGKPKTVNMMDVIFTKEWEATTERLRLPVRKVVGLCSYPMSTDELRNSPIYQIQYQNIGEVVGINVLGIRTNIKTLVKLSKNFSESELKLFLEANKTVIDKDTFWLVFAVERRVGGRWLFPKVSKTLLYCKPDQIIDMNSRDNVIRIRGVGITPQGAYELINDENVNVNVKQLLKDKSDVIFDEITLGTMSKMGEFVENAIKLDSEYRKRMGEAGINVQNNPVSNEVKT
jgi:hypothetical protein